VNKFFSKKAHQSLLLVTIIARRWKFKRKKELTNSTMKVPIRPIIQALEFQISAVFVKPRKGAMNFGSTLGIST
jgi:hypothetical protein